LLPVILRPFGLGLAGVVGKLLTEDTGVVANDGSSPREVLASSQSHRSTEPSTGDVEAVVDSRGCLDSVSVASFRFFVFTKLK